MKKYLCRIVYMVVCMTVCWNEAVHAEWQRDVTFPQQDVTDVEIIGEWMFISSFDSVFKKSAHDLSYQPVGLVDEGMDISKLFSINDKMIACTYNGGVFESNDSGITWVVRNTGLTGIGATTVSSIISRGTNVYIGTSGAGVFVSSTSGPLSWQPFRDGLLWNVAWDVYSLYQWNGILFAGTGQNGYVHRNVSGSSVWENVQFNENIGTGLAMLGFGMTDSGMLIGVGFNGIYNSTDTGSTWQFYPAPFNGANCGKVLHVNGRTLAILSHVSSGLFIYEWDNTTWNLIDQQSGIVAYDFEIFDGHIYAATWAGVYYYPLNPTDVEPDEPVIPNNHLLSQNYPNPFNPSTTIQFTLPERSKVEISVFNTLGQKVTTLIDGEFSAGNHQVEWNTEASEGISLSSGIYFYRIRMDEYTETKRMVLLK